MEYTYKLPADKDFRKGLIIMTQQMPTSDAKNDLLKLLDVGYCEIEETGRYATRWNALGVIVHLNVPIQIYSKYNENIEAYKSKLFDLCQKVMPSGAGYDVTDVSISPILESTQKDSLEELRIAVPNENYLNISEDLIEKGKKMANAYVTLYALENHIRNYIDTKLTEKLGVNYMDSIAVSRKVKSVIESRKAEEQSKKWFSLRGSKDLYYIDFIDLADVIVNNWEYFKKDIPNQEWIKVKMQEMYGIRCLIAHNSYISEDNFNLLNVTTKQILSQLYSK